jgi:hypothetical protein
MRKEATMARSLISVDSFASNNTKQTEKKDSQIKNAKIRNNPRWVENAPSYLDDIRAGLATLTDEQKDAIHESLQG